MAKTKVIVVASDQHCGSSLGLMTSEGVQVSDQNRIVPGKPVRWLWDQHCNFVDEAERIIKKHREKGATAHYINLGDLIDGDHHNTHQIIGRELGSHIEAARNVLKDGMLQLDFDTLHFVMGTPSHVGRAGGSEKSVAKDLEAAGYPVQRHPETDETLWPWVTARVHDYALDFRHHARSGTREHTRKSYAAIYAYDIWGARMHDGLTPVDLAFRAHKHKMVDSGPDLRGVTRVIVSGCWQHSSEWVESRAITSLPDWGGWIAVISDDMRGPYDPWVRPFQYQLDPEEEVVTSL